MDEDCSSEKSLGMGNEDPAGMVLQAEEPCQDQEVGPRGSNRRIYGHKIGGKASKVPAVPGTGRADSACTE